MDLKTETIPCKFCGVETRMLGTKMCDGCWSIRSCMRGMTLEAVRHLLVSMEVDGQNLVTAMDDISVSKQARVRTT